MPETPYSKFRLSEQTLFDLDALAASNGGNRSAALREAIAYWRAEVYRAGWQNAEELTKEEWALLASTGDPGDVDIPDEEPPARDWSAVLALSLSQMYEGRAVVLPSHKEEERAAKKLAKKIAGWGLVRGYALMAAIRYFWRRPEAGIGACAAPELWLTPTAVERE